MSSASQILRRPGELIAAGLVPSERRAELETVAARYAVALTPDIVELIDPANPNDPIGRQFIPDRAELDSHPEEMLDPIGDDAHSPVAGIVHRYPDRVLLKPVDVCAVYCRFCFRRETVGQGRALSRDQLAAALDYIRAHSEIWEVILTGGDPLVLSPRRLATMVKALAAIEHVKIIRVHSRVPVVEPARVTPALVRALKAAGKATYVVLHANHARELTPSARAACARLIDAGIPMLSQSVLLRGVNDDVDSMKLLVKKLGHMNVQPYYIYMHDLVKGVEDLRTPLQTAIDLEKHVRGLTAGFYTPTFVCDAPGGGGKRDVHSYEHYDRVTGISVFSAPSVKPGKYFTYFDPIDALPEEGQAKWADPRNHQKMIDKAIDRARAKRR
jgi:lysine 2,3-aminomutase